MSYFGILTLSLWSNNHANNCFNIMSVALLSDSKEFSLCPLSWSSWLAGIKCKNMIEAINPQQRLVTQNAYLCSCCSMQLFTQFHGLQREQRLVTGEMQMFCSRGLIHVQAKYVIMLPSPVRHMTPCSHHYKYLRSTKYFLEWFTCNFKGAILRTWKLLLCFKWSECLRWNISVRSTET